jgi:hypothetical protein
VGQSPLLDNKPAGGSALRYSLTPILVLVSHSLVSHIVGMSAHDEIPAEWLDWYHLTPAERWEHSTRLWETFRTLGGSLEPEPDTESPFFDAASWRPTPVDGRSSVRVLRSCGI